MLNLFFGVINWFQTKQGRYHVYIARLYFAGEYTPETK